MGGLRDENLLKLVPDLFTDHDDDELNAELHETARLVALEAQRTSRCGQGVGSAFVWSSAHLFLKVVLVDSAVEVSSFEESDVDD